MKTEQYTIFWTKSAQDDLESVIEYISKDSIINAKAIYEQIKSACLKLEGHPNIGRIIPELKIHNIEFYREIISSPWRIMYRVNEFEVLILAVIDSRRDITDALLARALSK